MSMFGCTQKKKYMIGFFSEFSTIIFNKNYTLIRMIVSIKSMYKNTILSNTVWFQTCTAAKCISFHISLKFLLNYFSYWIEWYNMAWCLCPWVHLHWRVFLAMSGTKWSSTVNDWLVGVDFKIKSQVWRFSQLGPGSKALTI